MATKTYAGVNVDVTDDGYLNDPSQWNKDIAAEIAKEEGGTILCGGPPGS